MCKVLLKGVEIIKERSELSWGVEEVVLFVCVGGGSGSNGGSSGSSGSSNGSSGSSSTSPGSYFYTPATLWYSQY